MTESPQPPTDSSERRFSEQSLGHFVRDLASALTELNSSVLSMTQYLVDGVLSEDLRLAVQTAAAEQASGEPHDSATGSYVVIDAPADNQASTPATSELQADSAQPAEGVAANAGSSSGHVPTNKRWYAVLVGRNPGIFQGAHHITPNIERIPGGLTVRRDTEADARKEFDRHLRAGTVKRVHFDVVEHRLTYKEFYGVDDPGVGSSEVHDPEVTQ